MQKVTKTATYDTDTATLVKKKTFGEFGDPAGYEETLYQTAEGKYFLYRFGGADSKYAAESITAMCKSKAEEWLSK